MYKWRFRIQHLGLKSDDQLGHAYVVEDGHDALVSDVTQGLVAIVQHFQKAIFCNQFQC